MSNREHNRLLCPGCTARWDSFAGLVPVRVDAIKGPAGRPGSDCEVQFTVTEDHGCYRRGEKHQCSALWVVPLGAIRRRKYDTTIGYYSVEPGEVTERSLFRLVA